MVNDSGTRTDNADTDVEDANFSLAEVFATNRRIQENPDEVSDEELREHFGEEIDVEKVRALFRRSTFGKEPKDKRASSRAKLRRRMLWLHRSILEVEAAIEEVLGVPGRTNKADELKALREVLVEFRAKAGLTDDGALGIKADPDLFERLFGEGRAEAETVVELDGAAIELGKGCPLGTN
ncbi:MAG: hypothetical protein H7840_16600 [Alphaproteobacteria bacterium]